MTAPRAPRILVVEDDSAVRLSLRLAGEKEGFAVSEAVDGPEAIERLAQQRPDLVILDLMLPGVSGFDVCRTIHQRDPSLPVIILTARGDEVDKVVGLEMGADDYITKPFSPRELIARVRAVLRRTSRPTDPAQPIAAPPPKEALLLGGLRIDLASRQVWVDERAVSLTRTEFELLLALATNAGRVLTRDQLVARVWGYEAEGGTRLLDSHIAHLRAKIESDPSHPRYLHTLRDVGFRLSPPAD
ncbi:MAG: response regulator transcription factor [Chloroflexi bacterium]|nr:response regulator transcription factor [Chloroflexota bacterium]